jgi:transaldolase/glucose-6-phosphate isomerase
MMHDRLKALEGRGQAVWLDFVERRFLAEGGLTKLVELDGVTGVTSNPSIFEKAMGHGDAYDADFAELAKDRNLAIIDIYEHLAIADIQAACDILRPVYDRLDGADGYASIEVSPYLARSTDGTIVEAGRLWKAVDRPNLMVKVPGTDEGVPAIRTLISEGININVTLLFAISAYEAVAAAYIEGLEARAAKGEDISHISSVASFFVSRIDGQIDKAIDDRVKADDLETQALTAIRGKVAIANAKAAYQSYLKTIAGKNWQAL